MSSTSSNNVIRIIKLLIISILLTIIQCQDICVWNSTSSFQTIVNGLYRKSTWELNGKPFYKLDRSSHTGCDASDTLYIYWLTSFQWWFIGSRLDSSNEINFYCEDSTAGDPTYCNGQWTMIGQDTFDESIQITYGPCPTLDCATIHYEDDTGSWNAACTETSLVYEQTGDNNYTLDSTSRAWWFNPATFKWYCTLLEDMELGCTVSNVIEFAVDPGWSDLSNGESWQFDVNNAYGATAGTFTCAGNATTTTPAPTTPNPTLAGTPQPSFLPIASPTNAPSMSPTSAPTTEAEAPANAPVMTPEPSSPTTQNPTTDDMWPGTTESEDGDGGGKKGNGGISDLELIIIIVCAVIFCCLLCCLIYLCLKKRKQKKEVYFGNTR